MLLTIERKKNPAHIIGQEVKEQYLVFNSKEIEMYVEHHFEKIDGETYEYYNDDIHDIYNLKSGTYNINEGDFTLYITIA